MFSFIQTRVLTDVFLFKFDYAETDSYFITNGQALEQEKYIK